LEPGALDSSDPASTSFYRDIWKPTQEATGLDTRPHECCHSYVTHLRAAGVNDHPRGDRMSLNLRRSAGTGATIRFMTTREKLHQIVDKLPEGELDAALRAIEARTDDPMIRRLDDAPPEDEKISPEEEAAVQEARDELAAGAPLISQDEIKRELGIE
jgi:hypothetical protein